MALEEPHELTCACGIQPEILAEDKSILEHKAALQALVNGKPVTYSDTLRMIKAQGSRAPPQPPPVTRLPPVRSILMYLRETETSTELVRQNHTLLLKDSSDMKMNTELFALAGLHQEPTWRILHILTIGMYFHSLIRLVKVQLSILAPCMPLSDR